MWLSSWFGWLSCSAPLSAFRFPCESLWCKINAFVSELELYPRSHSNDADMLNCAAVGFCVALGLYSVINQLLFVFTNDQWACEFLCTYLLVFLSSRNWWCWYAKACTEPTKTTVLYQYGILSICRHYVLNFFLFLMEEFVLKRHKTRPEWDIRLSNVVQGAPE